MCCTYFFLCVVFPLSTHNFPSFFLAGACQRSMRSAMERIDKKIRGRERWVFMEFKIKTGLSLKFDDEKILSWAYSPGARVCVVHMYDGSVVTVDSKNRILIEEK